jgi:hypothetical protein
MSNERLEPLRPGQFREDGAGEKASHNADGSRKLARPFGEGGFVVSWKRLPTRLRAASTRRLQSR